MRNASSDNMTGFSIYKDLMLTFGEKDHVSLWDLNKKELINMRNLEGKPSVVKFSTSGEMVGVGFHSGEIKLYDMSPTKELVLFQRIANLNCSVLNMVFGASDKKIAISLFNQKVTRDAPC